MYPERIVCLAAEAPEILSRLGALNRGVGISAHTKHPKEAFGLPRVSGFKFGQIERILKLNPHLAILTSYVQIDLASELIASGVSILHVSPHRLHDIFGVITLLGNVVGEPTTAHLLCEEIRTTIGRITELRKRLRYRPKVFFEHTSDPISCPPAWVSDIIETCGGIDVFRNKALTGRLAVERVIDPEEVKMASPDLFLCHSVQSIERHKNRWKALFPSVPAIQEERFHQLESLIFYFGPGTLIDSLNEIYEVLNEYYG